MKLLALLSALVLAFSVSACSRSHDEHAGADAGEHHEHADAHAHDHDHAAAGAEWGTPTSKTQTVEVGCGGCMYDMAGKTGCNPAVKIEGKTYWVEGLKMDTHGTGLCEATKPAEIAGEIKDGKFAATYLKIK